MHAAIAEKTSPESTTTCPRCLTDLGLIPSGGHGTCPECELKVGRVGRQLVIHEGRK